MKATIMAKSTASLALVNTDVAEVSLGSSISDQINAAQAFDPAEAEVIEEPQDKPAVVTPVTSRVVIKSDRAMPAATKGKASAYPWLSLEVGQSFFVAGAKVESFWSMCAERNKANPDRKFKACRFTEDGVAGVGVWRVA